MTSPRWEVEDIGEGKRILISHLESGGRIIELSVVELDLGGYGDFQFDVIDGDEVVHRGYDQTLPAAQAAAENHARRQLTKCVLGGR